MSDATNLPPCRLCGKVPHYHISADTWCDSTACVLYRLPMSFDKWRRLNGPRLAPEHVETLKRRHLELTADEVRDLAAFVSDGAGSVVLVDGPASGVDGVLTRYVAYWSEYPDEGCMPLGADVRTGGLSQRGEAPPGPRLAPEHSETMHTLLALMIDRPRYADAIRAALAAAGEDGRC